MASQGKWMWLQHLLRGITGPMLFAKAKGARATVKWDFYTDYCLWPENVKYLIFIFLQGSKRKEKALLFVTKFLLCANWYNATCCAWHLILILLSTVQGSLIFPNLHLRNWGRKAKILAWSSISYKRQSWNLNQGLFGSRDEYLLKEIT